MVVGAGNDISLIDPSANDFLVMNGTANKVLGTTGNETISASVAGNVFSDGGGTANVEFVSSDVGVNTVITGSGSDTIFAKGGVLYSAGSGKDLYVGGSGHSTVNGGTGNQTLFGGTGGDLINVNGSHDIIVNGGGSDTILAGSNGSLGGSSGSNPVTLFGNSGGDDRLINVKGSLLVAGGGTETVDASNSNPGNTFFVSDAPSIGNTTLVGSSGTSTGAFSDLFVVQSVAGANNTSHTTTIENFHQSDAFFLSGYGAGDLTTFANAVTNDPKPTGNLSVALSDGTTVSFVGGHPTNIFNGGAVAT